MKELMKELDSVFKMISRIPVSGDNVDLMAASRERLRYVYASLKKMDEDASSEVEAKITNEI